MNRINQAWKAALWMAGLFFFAASCSSISRLQATYRLPSAEGALAGRQAFVSVEDLRKDKRTLGEVAALRFEDSGGVISLSVAKETGPGMIKGIYQPPALLKEALESRMKHEGIQVVPEGAASTGLSVLLKSFFLDRAARKWKVAVSYEARLVREGQVLSSQIVSGEAERLDIMGTEQADVVLSEILTDVVNKLDLIKLFRASGL
jgi:hypothetical protein